MSASHELIMSYSYLITPIFVRAWPPHDAFLGERALVHRRSLFSLTLSRSRCCYVPDTVQNPEFFFSYHARLKMRDQIVAFNYLVDQQVPTKYAPHGVNTHKSETKRISIPFMIISTPFMITSTPFMIVSTPVVIISTPLVL